MGLNNRVLNTTVQNNSSGNNYSLILTCDSGYEFDLEKETLYATYTGTNGYGKSVLQSINPENTVATFNATDWNGDINDNCYIWGSTKKKEVVLDIQNSVNQTSFTYTETGKSDVNITLTCNEGYVFDGAPKVFFYTNNGYPAKPTFSLNETNTVATVTCSNADKSNVFEITGNTKKGGTTELNVTNNISDTQEQHDFDGVTATITVTGTYPRYRFFDPKVSYTDTEGNPQQSVMSVEVQPYKSIATAEISNVDPAFPVTITGTYENVCNVTNNLENCTVNGGLPEYYRIGANLNITATANAGTEFETDNPPQVYYLSDGGYPTIKKFTVSPDKNTATLLFDMSDPENEILDGSDLTFEGGAVPKQVIGQNYGAINVYIVTLDNLEEFAKKRFFKEVDDPETGPSYEYIDLGKYVNRIKRIHCTVPSSSTDVLKCGNYNTNISVLAPAVETINLDFGSVEIPAHNSDNTDYESEVQVFLPFKGFVTIPADYVGKSVNLEYVVNVVTGYGVAKLSCNGAVFQVEEVNPATDVLYRTADVNLTLIGADSWDESLLYGLTPYVYIKWYESRNKNERNADNVTGKIGDFSGFIKLDNVSTISTPDMLIMEQEMIYSELENGVYIE